MADERPWFTDFAALADEEIRLRLLDMRADQPSYHFAIEPRTMDLELGRILIRFDTHPSISLYAGNIGYQIHLEHRGHRYAARACRLLRPVALWHGVTELWIITSPDNFASRRTAELAGGAYVDTHDMPPGTDMYAQGMHQARRYRWSFDVIP
ncbi:MAG: GNAT family N-acetyltransferase [Nannocystis sp.]|nr:GNAT family N-acetyltransferase [Nannocystis sp.]MBA3548514.1 GNAT family N-acetyltransferase [Nannocystis sp.]